MFWKMYNRPFTFENRSIKIVNLILHVLYNRLHQIANVALIYTFLTCTLSRRNTVSFHGNTMIVYYLSDFRYVKWQTTWA